MCMLFFKKDSFVVAAWECELSCHKILISYVNWSQFFSFSLTKFIPIRICIHKHQTFSGLPILTILSTLIKKFSSSFINTFWTPLTTQILLQNQPFTDFLQKRSSEKVCKIHRFAGLEKGDATLSKKRLRKGYFPVNFTRFLSTSFLQNTSAWWLLLLLLETSNLSFALFLLTFPCLVIDLLS